MDRDGVIGIVGAGVAGLACASALVQAGRRVRVFEKSRGLGGRLATRRSEAGSFDHGAPGFSCTDPAFTAEVASAERAGQVAAWRAGSTRLLSGTGAEVFAGQPNASAFAHHIVTPLPPGTVDHGVEITHLVMRAGGWTIVGPDTPETALSAVVLAIPAPQAARLLSPAAPRTAAEMLEGVKMAPRLTAMFAVETPLSIEDLDAAVVAKVIRQNDLPGRADTSERWVIHATEMWSEAHIEREKSWIADRLIEACLGGAGPTPGEIYRAGHRWRYALTTRSLGRACLWDGELRLGLCGDWCRGDTVEDAWRSGRAAAAALIAA
ncbi:MAG: FAD-dependent oxidoreductase [Pseudomonadota bacterium]